MMAVAMIALSFTNLEIYAVEKYITLTFKLVQYEM